MAAAPTMSLICATIGRTAELGRLLESLAARSCRDFTFVVIDQNPDDRLKPIIARYSRRIRIRHVRCAVGVSDARNAKPALASGDVIGLPDDECWDPRELIEQVARFFESHPEIQLLTGAANDPIGEPRAGYLLLLHGMTGQSDLALLWGRVSPAVPTQLRASVGVRTATAF